MRNVVHVFRRETAALFRHGAAPVALAVFVLVVAAFALGLNDVLLAGRADLRTTFFWISATLVVFVPAVTMGLLSEEHRSGRLEILATLPLSPAELVVGKWLAAVFVVALGLCFTLPYPLSMATLASLDWGPVAGGYLGLFLMGGALAALGVAASAWTKQPMVAYLVTALLALVPWLTGFLLARFPGASTPTVQYMSLPFHLGNLASGVLDTRSVVFFVSLAALLLRVAVAALQWRRLR